jgi:hypothetical protein
MALLIITIIVVILFQAFVFYKFLTYIKRLVNYFPEEGDVEVSFRQIPREALSEGKDILDDVYNETDDQDEKETIETVVVVAENPSEEFKGALDALNLYLIKTRDSIPDFGLVQNTLTRRVDSLEERIASLISVPLYLGLGGTFIGIIYGVIGLDFSNSDNIPTDDLNALLGGVAMAMFASLFGLGFTVYNQGWELQRAKVTVNERKNFLFDHLQRELLPHFGTELSSTLDRLKDHLNDFNLKFGGNLKSYERNFELINDNLQKQESFIQAVQKVGVVKMASKVTDVFSQIDAASESFEKFVGYQEVLNENMKDANEVLESFKDTYEKYKDFNERLANVGTHLNESSAFYQRFKAFLDSHFGELEERKNTFQQTLEAIEKAAMEKIKKLDEYINKEDESLNASLRGAADQFKGEVKTIFGTIQDAIEAESNSLKTFIASEEKGLSELFEGNKEMYEKLSSTASALDLVKQTNERQKEERERIQDGLNGLGEKMTTGNAELLKIHSALLELNRNILQLNGKADPGKIQTEEQNQASGSQTEEPGEEAREVEATADLPVEEPLKQDQNEK